MMLAAYRRSHAISAIFVALLLFTPLLRGQDPETLPPGTRVFGVPDSGPRSDSSGPAIAVERPGGSGATEGTNQRQTESTESGLERRLQSGLPPELMRGAPDPASQARANRFLEERIEADLPLNLALGRPTILRYRQTPTRIYLPDEEIASAQLIDPQNGKELAVQGRRIGQTTMTLWFNDPQSPTGQSVLSYIVRVYGDPISQPAEEDFQRELNQKFPNSHVELDEIGGKLIVRGEAPNMTEMSNILHIIASARGAIGSAKKPLESLGEGAVAVVTGDPFAMQQAALAEQRNLNVAALEEAGIINLMKIPGEQQVMLRVTVAEVNRSAARSIGLNFGIDNAAGTVFRSTTGSITGNLLASLDMGQVRLAIEALRRLNLSRTLAEPNLVALNGQRANFEAGGQFPIPIVSSGGAGAGQNLQGVAFVPFGVNLNFLPIIQDRDVIRLNLQAEVSTRDESLGTNIGGGAGGTAVSGRTNRSFNTTVELRSGQTLAVAGLLQTNYGGNTTRVPLWGDLPLIGATGGVNRISSGEQELVILVTPELVAPVDACSAPAIPGNDIFEPTDIEFYLSNRLESRRLRDYRASVRTDYPRMRMPDKCCADKFLVGPVGPTDRCCNQPGPVPHAPLLQPQSTTPLPLPAPGAAR